MTEELQTTGYARSHGPGGVNLDALQRMRSVEGQVRGVQKMIEQERYCMEIVDQISAIRAALAKVSESVLKRHMETCVVEDLRNGSPEQQDQVIAELMDAIARRVR
ncbi:MAG: metal-sensitive transcriptional regulator [Spirochaeta sp.]|jgi:DNA-binding FrmR family transcriptional regulator|nr:metal-sensitive transcriptional regulator [Spirochaeta sp.]